MGLFSGEMRRFDKELKIIPDILICEGGEGVGGEEGRGGGDSRMLTSCPRCQATFPCSPEPSPSTPVSFVLPGGGGGGGNNGGSSPGPPPPPHHETEFQRLIGAVRRLRLSGWYHEGLTWKDSIAVLSSSPPGTFLVRDSSNKRFLFSLSVQTEMGPTSVRIHYIGGCFRLDAEPSLVPSMPLFEDVVALVEYYVSLTKGSKLLRSGGKEQVWLDCSGRMHSDIHLDRPLYSPGGFPSLKHLSRLAVNSLPRLLVHSSTIPPTLRQYLNEYPYTH